MAQSSTGRPETRTAPAVALSEISRRFGLRWALRGITLQVAPGEVVAVLGRNGSGKTTLLRVIATALRPSRGSGTVFGRDLVAEADAIRPLVGMLGHSPGLYEDLTAAENLRFALRMMGQPDDADAVRAALDGVGLGAFAGERVRSFSAGMRRRVALARITLRLPRILLLDEPFASFDAEGIGRLEGVIAAVASGGGAVLLATHDLDRARAVLTRSVELEAGRLSRDEAAPTSSGVPESRAGSASLRLVGEGSG